MSEIHERHRNDPVYKRVRLQVLQRDGWRCQIRRGGCRGRADTVDHMDGANEANYHDATRMRAACRPCNSGAGRPSGRGSPGPGVIGRTGWNDHTWTGKPCQVRGPDCAGPTARLSRHAGTGEVMEMCMPCRAATNSEDA